MLVSEFLKQSLEYKKSKTHSAMLSLANQLELTKSDLETTENRLRFFRENNPNIALNSNMTQINQEILSQGQELARVQNSLSRLKRLIDEKNNAFEDEDKGLIYLEMIRFLNEQSIPGITVLNEQYGLLVNEQEELELQGFSDVSPRMQELLTTIKTAQEKIDTRVAQYMIELNTNLESLGGSISSSEARILQSPKKQLQLAKMERERDAKSQVYTNVLVRYNEIKTAHASITQDAYWLEKAQVPIVYTGGIKVLISSLVTFALGPILGILFGIGFFIGLDFIWHKAMSATDISDQLSLPVISLIPTIKLPKKDKQINVVGKKMDDTLITIDYTPTVGGDAFRNLRTKLIFDKDSSAKYKVVITSLMPMKVNHLLQVT